MPTDTVPHSWSFLSNNRRRASLYDDDVFELDPQRPDWFDHFWSEGLVTEILMQCKSGKEATVFVCRGSPRMGTRLLAAKVYRDLRTRAFRKDDAYLHGRSFGKHREDRAVRTKTHFGRQVQAASWVGAEHEVLQAMWNGGAGV